jgi:hypothetical protein
LGGVTGAVLGSRSEAKKDVGTQLVNQTLERNRAGKNPESAEKTSGYDRLYNMLKMASDLDNPAELGMPTEDPPMVSPDPIGAPVGGPAMVPIAQSAEAMIGTSPRAVADANKAEMLQYISEDGQDGTLDMLEAAKVAHNKTRVLSFLDKEAAAEKKKHTGALIGAPTGAVLGGAGGALTAAHLINKFGPSSAGMGALPLITAGLIGGGVGGAALGGTAGGVIGNHFDKKRTKAEQAKAASMQTPDPMDRIKESLASIVAGMED